MDRSAAFDTKTNLEMAPILRECMAKPPAVLDAQGRALDCSGVINTRPVSSGVELEFRYTNLNHGRSKPGDPEKLPWDLPISTTYLTIPFHYNELPIP